jgi:hypothetical protein
VLRLQKGKPNFAAERELPLSDKDRQHRVLSDRIGRLPGSAGCKAPDAPFHELVLQDPKTHRDIRVLTPLLDVPAHVVGTLYRYRWRIEVCHPYCLHCHTFDESLGQGLGRVKSAA